MVQNYQSNFNIKKWAEEDRPREKLLLKGKSVLSDAELLAIILGSGSRNESAVGLAQRLLLSVENDLNTLGKLSITDLVKFKGIGEAKAIGIIAMAELGRRRQLTDIRQKPKITCSKDAYNCISSVISDLPYEEFWVLFLNKGNRVIYKDRISQGGVSGTVVDSKIVFKKALDLLSSSIILVHNHPSGNCKPSHQDIAITKKLRDAGKYLDIAVLDHLIIAEMGYFSFGDEGMM